MPERVPYSTWDYFSTLKWQDDYCEINVPEISDRNEHEPFEQIKRGTALLGHRTAVHDDISANEMHLSTCLTQRALEGHAMGRGYVVTGPMASIGEYVAKLSADHDESTVLLAAGGMGQTRTTSAGSSVRFISQRDVIVSETGALQFIIGIRGGNYTTNFRAANDISSAYYGPWPGAVLPGDCIYFGHGSVMFTGLNILRAPLVTAAGFTLVWEYHQGQVVSQHPAAVTRVGDRLEFDLSSLLGTNNHEGAIVRIVHMATGAYHEGQSVWSDGRNVLVDCSLLGQLDPSTELSDYGIGGEWLPLNPTTDEVGTALAVDGEVSWDLPQSTNRAWRKTSVEGAAGYFVRTRVIGLTGSTQTLPSLDMVTFASDRYAIFDIQQGQTVANESLGSTAGAMFERLRFGNEAVFPKSITLEIQEGATWYEYEIVTGFHDSESSDRHARFMLDRDGQPCIQLGSGISGRRPPTGSAVRASYNIGSEANGNVGARAISGFTNGYLIDGYNPRPMIGWSVREGSTFEDFEITRQRIMHPASTLQRGITRGDIERLVENYTTVGGTKPIARASVIRRSDDILWLACVPRGSGENVTQCKLASVQEIIPQSVLADAEVWINGDEVAGTDGRIFAGGSVRLISYVPKPIGITMIAAVTRKIERSVLLSLYRQWISPTAVDPDGKWLWRHPGENVVSRDLLRGIFFRRPEALWLEPEDTGLRINSGIVDIALGWQELPVLDPAQCSWEQRVISNESR